MSNISTNIKGIRDIMRKDTGVDGDAQRISQMVWMLFMKIFADKEEEWEITIDNYVSPIPEKLKWQNWAADDEGLTGDLLMEFIETELFPTLKELDITISPQAKIIRSVFDDTYNFMKNGTLFRQVINVINQIDFNSTSERHVFNDIYETILKDLQSAGSSGEYYTPRAVTQFMVDMINPQLGESVLDPACGTGGFLTCTIDAVRDQVKTPKDREVLQKSIRGIEKKPLPHLLCTTNLMLHGFDLPVVRRDNLLSKPYADWGAKDKLDIILSNPPFGGVEEDGTETNFPKKFRTKETADLFLALIIKLLKTNGRCAIVLPDGTLFGEGMKTRLKEELLEKCNLHTIVRLPNGVFNPYTGIKTNLLFFEKGAPTKEIWYYEHPYPNGVKSYNKGKPVHIKEFDTEKAWWNNRKENTQAWKVSIEEIKKRGYNLDIKNPHQEADTLESPEVLFKKNRITEKKISSIQDKFINVLSESLKNKQLLKHFKELTIISENARELKGLFLKLAVKGELTTNWRVENSEIQSASKYLEQLKGEKDNLIKEKKIRKEKPLSKIKKEELINLPKKWEMVRLGEIGDWGAGSTPLRSNSSFYDGEINWFKSGELNNGIIDFESKEKITDLAIQKSSVRLNKPGDVLIAMYGATIGKTAILNVKGTTNQAVCACTPFSCISSSYLHILLKALKDTFINQGEGGAQPNISRVKIRNQAFALPPLEEQKAIVQKVNTLMDLCDRLEQEVQQSKEHSEQLMQSCLREVFEPNNLN